MESEDNRDVEQEEPINGKKDVKRKEVLIMVGIGLIVLSALFITHYYKEKQILEELPDLKTAECIANRTILLTSPGCGHCANQKKILDKYLTLFEEVNCVADPDTCLEYGIPGVPSWVILGEDIHTTVSGVKSWKELIELTSC